MVSAYKDIFHRGEGAANLNRMVYFCAVVEAGSFTLAADRLGVGKAVVSQQVAKLERELKTVLLLRSTRRLAVTEAGARFHQRCLMVLKAAEQAFEEVAAATEEPVGTLRVAAPFDFGLQVLVPVIGRFRSRYPHCQVEAAFSDGRHDLMSGEYDLSIRVGWLTELHLSARRLDGFRQLLVGPGQWAGRAGRQLPAAPDELVTWPFVANRALRDPLNWHFRHEDGREARIRMNPELSFDVTLAVKEAVLAGAGAAVLPDFLVRADLKAGRLCRLLPDWALPEGEIHAVFPSPRYRPARVRAFLAMLAEWMAAQKGVTGEETDR